MRFWQVVFNKEFREIFRDGRTRFNIILSPLLITPIVLAVVGSMARQQANQAKKEVVPAAIVGIETSPTLASLLRGAEREKIQLTPLTTRADAEARIRSRAIRAAIVVPEDTEARLKEDRPVALTLLLDQGSQSSQEAAERLRLLVSERGKRLVATRLMENGLSQELANPFTTREAGIVGGGSRGTVLLATFLPYILALSAIMGGIYLANDTVAGEKERGTLETLLVTPASRRDLVFGKFLAVAAVALVNGVLSIVGLIWPFYVKLPAFSWMSDSGLTLSLAAIAAMFLVQIPLAVLGAGLLLSISTFARNQREAQTYLSPLLLCVTVAALLTMLLKADSGVVWALVPITNAALVLKQALEGVTSPVFVAVACAASALYAAAAVWFASRLFQQEKVLLKA